MRISSSKEKRHSVIRNALRAEREWAQKAEVPGDAGSGYRGRVYGLYCDAYNLRTELEKEDYAIWCSDVSFVGGVDNLQGRIKLLKIEEGEVDFQIKMYLARKAAGKDTFTNTPLSTLTAIRREVKDKRTKLELESYDAWLDDLYPSEADKKGVTVRHPDRETLIARFDCTDGSIVRLRVRCIERDGVWKVAPTKVQSEMIYRNTEIGLGGDDGVMDSEVNPGGEDILDDRYPTCAEQAQAETVV